MRTNHLLRALAEGLPVIAGIVLIWRGIWYVADEIDVLFFGGSHVLTALASIVIGLALLYLPDRNLKELTRL